MRWAAASLAAAVAGALTAAAWAGEPPSLKPLARLETLPKRGDLAPTFRLRALDGTLVKLSERAYPGPQKRGAKKRPVMLDFFRTDCSPCRAAMPELIAFSKRYRGVDLIIVALLEDSDGRGKLERYLDAEKLPFTVIVDAYNLVAEKYLGKSVRLPATFLIDENGTVVARRLGAAGALEREFGAAARRALKMEEPQ